MKPELKEGYDFVNSMMEYEDPEYLEPFTDLQTVKEHIDLYVEGWQDEFPQILRDPETLMTIWNECLPKKEPEEPDPEPDPAGKQYLLKTFIENEIFYSVLTGREIADRYEENQIAGIYDSMTVWSLDGDNPERINLLDLVEPILENKRWMEHEYRDYCDAVNEYGYDFEGRDE